jgi:hypothetical protein
MCLLLFEIYCYLAILIIGPDSENKAANAINSLAIFLQKNAMSAKHLLSPRSGR